MPGIVASRSSITKPIASVKPVTPGKGVMVCPLVVGKPVPIVLILLDEEKYN